MIVMVVTDNYDINHGQILNLTRRRRKAFQALGINRCTAVFEDRVEEDAQTGGIFDKKTGMAEPCGAEFWRLSIRMESWFMDWNSWWSCVWGILLA